MSEGCTGAGDLQGRPPGALRAVLSGTSVRAGLSTRRDPLHPDYRRISHIASTPAQPRSAPSAGVRHNPDPVRGVRCSRRVPGAGPGAGRASQRQPRVSTSPVRRRRPPPTAPPPPSPYLRPLPSAGPSCLHRADCVPLPAAAAMSFGALPVKPRIIPLARDDERPDQALHPARASPKPAPHMPRPESPAKRAGVPLVAKAVDIQVRGGAGVQRAPAPGRGPLHTPRRRAASRLDRSPLGAEPRHCPRPAPHARRPTSRRARWRCRGRERRRRRSSRRRPADRPVHAPALAARAPAPAPSL